MTKDIAWVPAHPDTTGWKTRHLEALHSPQGFEIPLVGLLVAWAQYTNTHKQRYKSKIGDDYVLGPHWAAIGMAIIGLLNGESGRLDCGTLDTIIRDNLVEQGFDPDTM